MKRYDSYKDSGVEWIGEIPSHWDITKIKYLFNTQKGKTPKVLLDIENIESNVYLSMDFLRGEPKQIFYVSNDESVITTEENETLLLWDGSNAGEFIKSKKGVLSSTMALIKTNSINNTFQWYFFKSFEPLLKDSCNGMGIPHVDGKYFRSSEFLIPSDKEQTTIANYLDHKTTQIDHLIAKKEQLIQLLEEERVAIINQAVTKGLDPTVPMKDSGIEWLGEIPEHWQTTIYKRVTKRIVVGIAEAATQSYVDYGGVPILRSTNIKNSRIKGQILKISKEFAEKNKSKKLFANDLVTVRTGYPGATAIVDDFLNGCQCFTMLISTLNPQSNPKFYNYLLNSKVGKSYFELTAWGSAQKNISVPILSNAPIVILSFEEQSSIVKYLDDKEKGFKLIFKTLKNEIELLKEYKTALISEVVTGKVDVRN